MIQAYMGAKALHVLDGANSVLDLPLGITATNLRGGGPERDLELRL